MFPNFDGHCLWAGQSPHRVIYAAHTEEQLASLRHQLERLHADHAAQAAADLAQQSKLDAEAKARLGQLEEAAASAAREAAAQLAALESKLSASWAEKLDEQKRRADVQLSAAHEGASQAAAEYNVEMERVHEHLSELSGLVASGKAAEQRAEEQARQATASAAEAVREGEAVAAVAAQRSEEKQAELETTKEALAAVRVELQAATAAAGDAHVHPLTLTTNQSLERTIL